MIKKTILPILLLLTIPLGELYNIGSSPEVVNKAWFICSKEVQDRDWYIKDSAEGLTWLILLCVWWYRERKRNRFWADIVKLFIIFRLVDIGCYWVNHRHAGKVYLLTYLSIFIYGCGIAIRYYKRK